MYKSVGVVNKPQFDTNLFKSGTPIHFKKHESKNHYVLRDFYALVDSCNPLKLKVWAHNKSDQDFDLLEIDINDVIVGEYEINLMCDE